MVADAGEAEELGNFLAVLEADSFEGGAGPGVPGTRIADIAVDHFRVAVADLSATLVDEGEEEPEVGVAEDVELFGLCSGLVRALPGVDETGGFEVGKVSAGGLTMVEHY